MFTDDRIVLEPERRQITGLSRSHAWALERRGQFPARRQIAARKVGWLYSELIAWINSRQRGSTPAPVAALKERERRASRLRKRAASR